MNLIQELVQWLQALPGDFAFLLALPFAVGAAGLWAEWRRERKAQPRPSRARGGAPAPVAHRER
ncbi:MAG TPA: hypothetical protein PLD37_14285, partial [Usitatibacteraceae bacterium]|nr:hypothetical protein [Usitatibacteraceae bacterium]